MINNFLKYPEKLFKLYLVCWMGPNSIKQYLFYLNTVRTLAIMQKWEVFSWYYHFIRCIHIGWLALLQNAFFLEPAPKHPNLTFSQANMTYNGKQILIGPISPLDFPPETRFSVSDIAVFFLTQNFRAFEEKVRIFSTNLTRIFKNTH